MGILFLFNQLIKTKCKLQVGILDVDLCGPSVPYLLNLEGGDKYIHQSSEGYVLSLCSVSINSLVTIVCCQQVI